METKKHHMLIKNNPMYYTKSELPWRLIGYEVLDKNNNIIATVSNKIDGEFIVALANDKRGEE